MSSYLREIEYVFSRYNKNHQTDLKIKSITTTNYYSIAAFLYASDFSSNKIFDEMWEINNLIAANPDVNQKYDSKMW